MNNTCQNIAVFESQSDQPPTVRKGISLLEQINTTGQSSTSISLLRDPIGYSPEQILVTDEDACTNTHTVSLNPK